METWAAVIKLRSQRRIGEISKTLEKAPGSRADNPLPAGGTRFKGDTLKAAGISTSSANRCEEISVIPEEAFEAYMAAKAEKKQPVSARDEEALLAVLLAMD